LIINIDGENDFQEWVDKGGVQIIKFSASWCQPCLAVDNILEEIADDIKEPILKVDVDLDPEIAGEFGIMSIPTISFFKDKKEVDRLHGYQTKEHILEILELVRGE
jgi:thioredoxin 1